MQRAWQKMLSGRRLDIINPSPLDIEIEDIAHGLAFQARWNGQTRGKYVFSVANHSILVWNILLLENPKIIEEIQEFSRKFQTFPQEISGPHATKNNDFLLFRRAYLLAIWAGSFAYHGNLRASPRGLRREPRWHPRR